MAYVVSFEGERCPEGVELVMVESLWIIAIALRVGSVSGARGVIPSDPPWGCQSSLWSTGAGRFRRRHMPPFSTLHSPARRPLAPSCASNQRPENATRGRLEGMRNSLVQKFMTCRPAAETPADPLAFVAGFRNADMEDEIIAAARNAPQRNRCVSTGLCQRS